MSTAMSGQQKCTFALLLSISLFLFAGQNVMNPAINEIMAEYHINETQIGVVGSAFTLVGALVGVLFGYCSDRFSRKNLFILVVFIGEVACLLNGMTYFTQSYTGLLWLRILAGIGIGSIFPITFSLVGDYFDSRYRATVAAWVMTSWGIGQLLGQILSGFLVNSMGWRFPFLLSALPNVVLLPIFWLLAQEPERGAQEQELAVLHAQGREYHEKFQWADIRFILHNKTNWFGLLQGIPGSIPWGVLPFFLVPFYEQKGYSKEFATILTIVLGIGVTVGGLVGGYMGDMSYRRSPRYLPLFCTVAILAGIVPSYFVITLNFPASQNLLGMGLPLLVCLIAGFTIALPSGNCKAILLNVNAPEHRGSVFALHNITESLGRGLGPILGGIAVQSYGYIPMMVGTILLWIPCALLYALMVFTLEQDLRILHKYLEAKIKKY